MNEDWSSQYSPQAEIKALPSTRSKVWQMASIVLIAGGTVLFAMGGWMYYQQHLEASKPPPARIVEMPVDNLNQTATPQPGLTPVVPTSTPQIAREDINGAILSDTLALKVSSVNQTEVNQTDSSQIIPKLTATVKITEPVPAPPIAEPTDLPIIPTEPPAVDGALSLAENPLLVVEEEQTSGEVKIQPDSDEALPAAVSKPAGPTLVRIAAESINLEADIIEVGWQVVTQNSVPVNVWTVADYAAGWHSNSLLPGQGGNVVLSAHHNIKGEVFRYIVDLEPGNIITLYSKEGHQYNYAIEDKFILKDKGEPEPVRRANAKWIAPFNDERLTLVTCWPYNNNTHRVIVIGKPVDSLQETSQ